MLTDKIRLLWSLCFNLLTKQSTAIFLWASSSLSWIPPSFEATACSRFSPKVSPFFFFFAHNLFRPRSSSPCVSPQWIRVLKKIYAYPNSCRWAWISMLRDTFGIASIDISASIRTTLDGRLGSMCTYVVQLWCNCVCGPPVTSTFYILPFLFRCVNTRVLKELETAQIFFNGTLDYLKLHPWLLLFRKIRSSEARGSTYITVTTVTIKEANIAAVLSDAV